jgi:multicomponent Na+:H+ antiporter subunit D
MNSDSFLGLFAVSQLLFSFLVLIFREKARYFTLIHALSLLVFSITWSTGAWGRQEMHTILGGWEAFRGISLYFDVLSLRFLFAASAVFTAVAFFSFVKIREWRFFFLMDLCLSSLVCVFLVNDLFNGYVTLELLSLVSYLLISLEGRRRQVWASLKYMIIGAVAFNLYLIGAALIYHSTGYLNLDLIAASSGYSQLGLVLIVIALLVKSGAFLMSMWLPSAHSEAISPVSTLLSGILVKAGIFLIFRIMGKLDAPMIVEFITQLGLWSSLAGVLFAMVQQDIKLILAFHTMSQMGYALAGIRGEGSLYAMNHALFKAILFMAADRLYVVFKTRNVYKIREKEGLVPITTFLALLVGYLSIAGLPFLDGFSPKFHVIEEQNLFGKIILILSAIGTVASIGKIIIPVFPKVAKKLRDSWEQTIGFFILGFGCLSIGIAETIEIDHKTEAVTESLAIFFAGLIVLKWIVPKIHPFFPKRLFELRTALMLLLIITTCVGAAFLLEGRGQL